MKIEPKKIRLAAVAFVCGFLFCAVLVAVTQRPPPPVVVSGPKLASSQAAGSFIIRLPPDERSRGLIHVQRDPLSDATLPGSRRAPGLDLIDMRSSRIDTRDIQ